MFISVKLFKTLLHNRQPGNFPIIVIAQTNHILNQLFIYCLTAKTNIICVGRYTENETIIAYIIYKL